MFRTEKKRLKVRNCGLKICFLNRSEIRLVMCTINYIIILYISLFVFDFLFVDNYFDLSLSKAFFFPWIRNKWYVLQDWYYEEDEPFVEFHVTQAPEILVESGFCGTGLLERIEKIRTLDRFCDLRRHIYKYDILYTSYFYDHIRDELVIYACYIDLTYPDKRSGYWEAYRTKRPENCRIHASLKAYIYNWEKNK